MFADNYKPTLMSTLNVLRDLIAIDSPTGYTNKAIEFIEATLRGYGFSPTRTKKGALRCSLGEHPSVALAGHTDTLGAIVAGLNSNGTLKFSVLGGPLLPSFEGGYVRIHTLDNRVYTGTMLLNDPSTHANHKAASTERTSASMHIRLDEEVSSREDVVSLGIRTGDIVAFDPKYQELSNGFIKSHFLDNKAGCYVLLEVARLIALRGAGAPVSPRISTTCGCHHFITSNQSLIILSSWYGNCWSDDSIHLKSFVIKILMSKRSCCHDLVLIKL